MSVTPSLPQRGRHRKGSTPLTPRFRIFFSTFDEKLRVSTEPKNVGLSTPLRTRHNHAISPDNPSIPGSPDAIPEIPLKIAGSATRNLHIHREDLLSRRRRLSRSTGPSTVSASLRYFRARQSATIRFPFGVTHIPPRCSAPMS